VVDVPKGNGQESPDAKYLAESSNRTLKETRAAHPSPTRAKAGSLLAKVERPPAAQKARAATAPVPRAAPSPSAERFPGLDGLQPRLSDLLHAASERAKALGPDFPAKPGAFASSGSGTTDYPVESNGAGAASPDDLSGVEKGEGTFLNTREWKYAGFFNRMKQAVAERWDPAGRLRSMDPQGVRYGVGDRVTILSVGLGLDGRIKNLSVVRSSGLDFLDLEATQAFERAQPFPNPPVGLAKDGLIQFGFGFRISADASAPPQMFRFGR